MISLFGILLYPIVFLILYAVCEVIFPTRNSAMIISLFAAFPVCLLYVRVRTRARKRAEGKKSERQRRREHTARLMLLKSGDFAALFPGCLCDQSASGVTEEVLLEYLRRFGCEKPVDVVSLNGVTPGAESLAALLRVELRCASEQDIFARTQDADLPDLPPLYVRRRLRRVKAVLTSAQTRRFCLRYGLLLLFLSILTPFRLYYWLFGGILLGIFTLGVVRSRINRRNQIPILRSE